MFLVGMGTCIAYKVPGGNGGPVLHIRFLVGMGTCITPSGKIISYYRILYWPWGLWSVSMAHEEVK